MAPVAWAAIAVVVLLACCDAANVGKRDGAQPNIIWIFGDDYGFNDIGYRDPTIITPNMDDLAANGIIFENAYVAPQCSPSRSALLSGLEPYKTAMQHSVILDMFPECMGLDYKFIPEYLKELGYQTHALGKWHLGYCRKECTPTYRGFDTFYGGYSGEGNYTDHFVHSGAYDWHDGIEVDASVNGTHSQTLLETRGLEIFDSMDTSTPFFLYLAFHNVHSPLISLPQYMDLYPDFDGTDTRLNYLGLVSGMDDVIGKFVQKLKDIGLYDNTIIMFSSDNGGDRLEGNNMPYRGTKASLWEGGCRAISWVHSPLLTTTGIHHDGLIHVTDWLPTILSLAGSDLEGVEHDGFDQTDMVMNGGESKRTGLIYNMDREIRVGYPSYGEMAARNSRYKLIWGFPGLTDGYGIDQTEFICDLPYYMDVVDKWTAADHTDKRWIEQDIHETEIERLRRGGPYLLNKTQRYYQNTYMQIVGVHDDDFDAGTGSMILFDLQEDPYEHTDIIDSTDPDVVAAKEELIKVFQDAMKVYVPQTPEGNTPVTNWQEIIAATGGALYPGWCEDTFPVQ